MADLVSFRFEKGSEWEAVIRALGEVESQLPAEFRRRIKKIVDPLVVEAKRKVEDMPVKHRGHTGLRHEVAESLAAIEVGFGANYSVTVKANMPAGIGGENEAVIPLGLDRLSGWRHPVFGNRNRWVTQVPLSHGWFTGTFDGAHDDIEKSLVGALEWARDKISAAGHA